MLDCLGYDFGNVTSPHQWAILKLVTKNMLALIPQYVHFPIAIRGF